MKIAVGSERVKELKEWFTDYVRTFQHREPEKQQKH